MAAAAADDRAEDENPLSDDGEDEIEEDEVLSISIDGDDALETSIAGE